MTKNPIFSARCNSSPLVKYGKPNYFAVEKVANPLVLESAPLEEFGTKSTDGAPRSVPVLPLTRKLRLDDRSANPWACVLQAKPGATPVRSKGPAKPCVETAPPTGKAVKPNAKAHDEIVKKTEACPAELTQVAHIDRPEKTKTASSVRRLADFGVPMPNLLTVEVDLVELPDSLQNGLHYLILTSFPPHLLNPNFSERGFLPALLPKDGQKRTLVLDLDETLVHCSQTALPHCKPDQLVRFTSLQSYGHVYYRPYVKLFLEVVSKLFEVVVFTASMQSYADQVIDALDENGTIFRHRLYRGHCTEVNGGYVKDLRRLGRETAGSILVDNSPVSFALQMDQGVLVSSWFGDQNDQELVELLFLLQHLHRLEDSRLFLSRRYGFREWINWQRAGEGLHLL